MKTNNYPEPETPTSDENCFWQLDLNMEELHWSDGICLLLGFQKPNTPTFGQLLQLGGEGQNLRAAFNRAIHQGIPFQLKIPSFKADDQMIVVYTIGVPVYDDYGKCIAIKGTVQSEKQLEKFVASDENSSEKTHQLQLMLTNFARIVSHDLRSHTLNLQMAIESAEQKNRCEEMQELLNNLKTISQNLNQTVGYLNTLTKI